ncbi:MAG: hypothetical protein ACTMIS_04715, partial [Pseudomonas putida]
MIAQVFVRHAIAVKGSDSIGPIGKAGSVQNALCKMHDHATCTVPPLKTTHKCLYLMGFSYNQVLARSLQPSTHVC